MVVCHRRRGDGSAWRLSPVEPFLQISGHTTTQPSSIEEEGYRWANHSA
jgi:hypothetical protein